MSLQQLSVACWHEHHLGRSLKCGGEGPPPVVVNSIILQQVSEFAILGHFPGDALKMFTDIKESFPNVVPPFQLPTHGLSSSLIASHRLTLMPPTALPSAGS